MSLLNKIAPQWAFKRAVARRNLEALNSAATTTAGWKPLGSVGSYSSVYVEQARELEATNSLAAGALRVLTDNVIGQGIHPEPLVKSVSGELHLDFADQFASIYKNWSKHPEVTGQLDVAEMQRIMARTLYRDGDVLYQHVQGNVAHLAHRSHVPYSVELLEGDYLAAVDKPNIINGIEFNAWHAPVAYHLYKSLEGYQYNQDTKRVSAEFIEHLKLTNRINQARGVGIFAIAFKRLQQIEETEETELMAAKIASAIVGVEKRENLTEGSNPVELNDAVNIWRGGQNDDFQLLSSNRPNVQVVEFMKGQIRSTAVGLPIGYSSWSKDYNGTYSSQRQELVESYMTYGALSQYFIAKACIPMYKRLIDTAIASGELVVPVDVDLSTLYDANFIKPMMPWIDPVKEAKGNDIQIANHTKSRAEVIRERNKDPRETATQIKQEAETQKELQIEETE